MKKLYKKRDSYITGGVIQKAESAGEIQFKRVLNRRQELALKLFGILMALSDIAFIGWLLLPSHIPHNRSEIAECVGILGFIVVVAVELIRITQGAIIWLFASKALDPIPLEPQTNLRVAVLTTIIPSKEPISLVRKTLKAMRNIRYEGRVDVWILDEENDPRVKRMASKLGAHHFSRKGQAKYNQLSGEFKAKTKAGNHNSWRAENENLYDVVAQMDPDHIPLTNFLERTLGYFRDPNVAFVVAPQVYGNQSYRWLTRAAASQAYIFHGINQRGGNGFGSPLLIGTNHLYRTQAWKQIGGYQDSIIEDHLTSMRVHGAFNPKTFKRWKSIYTPDILSVGEGPQSWTDYFNQQKRWAYGIWEILLKHARSHYSKLSSRQRLSYAAMEFFYPSVGIVWIASNLITALYLLLGISSINVQLLPWITLWLLSVGSQLTLFFWLNRFNLTEHERRHGSKDAMLLTLLTVPVYAAATISAISRRSLAYAVTAKGKLRSEDSFATYRPHLVWAMTAAGLLVVEYLNRKLFSSQTIWDVLTLLVTMIPILGFIIRDKINPYYHKTVRFLYRPINTRRVYLKPQAGNRRTVPLTDLENVKFAEHSG